MLPSLFTSYLFIFDIKFPTFLYINVLKYGVTYSFLFSLSFLFFSYSIPNILFTVFFLETQLISNLGVTHRLTHSLTDNITFRCYSHISIIVDRFGLSLRFCHLEFDKEVKYGTLPCFGGDLRELSFCGPCGPCFYLSWINITWIPRQGYM